MKSSGDCMARPATKKASGLFATWIQFRSQVKGQDLEAVRRSVNKSTGFNYSYSRFHEFLHGERSVPDPICRIINRDMRPMLEWLLAQNLDARELAKRLALPIKTKE